MSRNGSGVYTLPKPPFVPNTTISSADVNSDFTDIASALTGSLAADGQTPLTGMLKFLSGTAAAPSHTFASALDTGMYFPSTNKLGFSAGGLGLIILDIARKGIGQDGAILTYTDGAIISPVGRVTSFAGATAPSGWLLCYGQAVPRSGPTGYPELFFIIGTTYGSGDGSTTFNLPDLRGRTIYGKDDMGGSAANRITTAGSGLDGLTLGAGGGSQTRTLLTVNLPAYTPAGSNASSSVTISGQGSGTLIQNNTGPVTSPGFGVVFGTTTLTASAAAQTFTGTAQGGTSTPFAILSPGMIMNKIIFAGRV